jgi:hypothetical protein
MLVYRRRATHDASWSMNWRLSIVLRVTLLGATVFVLPAPAQVRGIHVAAPAAARRFAPAPRTVVPFRVGPRTRFAHLRRHRSYPGSAFLSYPYFFYPDYDYGYDYEPSAPSAPPPRVVYEVAQPPAQTATPCQPAEPLVLERQGDQWVRLGSYGQSPTRGQSVQAGSAQMSNPPSSMAERSGAAQPSEELPPAVLVFRGGRQEEVKRYMIVGAAIYTRADYWSTGSWTRRIAITDLDVPATLKLNEGRGAKFSLPSGPDEVVVRP